MVRYIRSHRDIEPAVKAICDLDTAKQWQIEIKRVKSRRSLAQNRLMWMWLGEIQAWMRDHCGEIASSEEWHEVFLSRLLPMRVVVLDGEPVEIRQSTRRMTVAEMRDYLELLEMYCAENLGLNLTKPEEIYLDALMRHENAENN